MDTKLAIAVGDDLADRQKLNITAFLASGRAGALPELMGAPYVDADGGAYLPLLGHPVVVLTGGLRTRGSLHSGQAHSPSRNEHRLSRSWVTPQVWGNLPPCRGDPRRAPPADVAAVETRR